MKFQDKPGIYVYWVSRNIEPKLQWYYFATPELFCRKFSEYTIRYAFGDISRVYEVNHNENPRTYYGVYYAAYDENGEWISVDRLIGYYNQFEKNRYDFREIYRLARQKRRQGRKKAALGNWTRERHFKMYSENMYHDPEAEEMFIHVRQSNRVKKPDPWCDARRQHCEKSWKWQSKRKHQYREK